MQKIFVFVVLSVVLPSVLWGQDFVHPGMLHTNADLKMMKERILSGKEPWRTAWHQLKSSQLASLDYHPHPYRVVSNGPYNRPDIGGSDFVRDGSAAYTMALLWYVEQKREYAEKVIEIFDAWSITLDSIVNHNRQLKVGTAGIKYLNAAEILKYTYTEWPEEKLRNFENMVYNIWYPVIKDWTPRYNGNWDAANAQTLMCIGIFLDRRDIFDNACRQIKDGPTNGSIKNYFDENGQCQESGRDQQHVQMGLCFLACAAEIAWNQGVDLYSTQNNRLYRGFEYTAKYMCGEVVPYKQFVTWYGRPVFGDTISSKQREKIFPAWERAYHHYHERKKMEMPYTRKIIKLGRKTLNKNQSFMPWSTLTCAGK